MLEIKCKDKGVYVVCVWVCVCEAYVDFGKYIYINTECSDVYNMVYTILYNTGTAFLTVQLFWRVLCACYTSCTNIRVVMCNDIMIIMRKATATKPINLILLMQNTIEATRLRYTNR